MLRRTLFVTTALLIGGIVLGTLVLSCAKKTETASQTSSDSLLSANPQEQGQGNLTPQQGYQSAPPASAPAPTRAPSHRARSSSAGAGHSVTVPSGTPIPIRVDAAITTETANVGDGWTGSVENPVIADGRVVIPAGSMVHGTVTEARPARKGDRATLGLGLSSVEINGHSYPLHGSTEPIVAGSTRARNIGAVAGGAAAGALVGHAIGGGKGTLIGGLLGGAAATGAVAKSKGYQVELKSGTSLTFTTNQSLAVRM